MRHRRSMFADMGNRMRADLDAMDASSRPLFARALGDGSYRGWLAREHDGRVVAGGGIIMLPYHSSPRDPSPQRAWIGNMYTEPRYRRPGPARRARGGESRGGRGQGVAYRLPPAGGEGG